MKFLKTNLSPIIKKLALDMGFNGSNDYSKFVLLGRSRVGSNFLRGLLNSHGHIAAYGEIFKDCSSLDWDHLGYFQSRRIAELIQNDPIKFVDKKVLGNYPAWIQAVGFKLFYYHARDRQFASIWLYLRQRRDIKIIHIKRKNVLKTHLSRKRAELTDHWVNTSGKNTDRTVVQLDYAECLEDFIRTRTYEDELDRFFDTHPKLEVMYENLVRDYQAEMKRVQGFLGVELADVEPSTFRQTDQPLHVTIANYSLLKQKFAGTPWEQFFVD